MMPGRSRHREFTAKAESQVDFDGSDRVTWYTYAHCAISIDSRLEFPRMVDSRNLGHVVVRRIRPPIDQSIDYNQSSEWTFAIPGIRVKSRIVWNGRKIRASLSLPLSLDSLDGALDPCLPRGIDRPEAKVDRLDIVNNDIPTRGADEVNTLLLNRM